MMQKTASSSRGFSSRGFSSRGFSSHSLSSRGSSSQSSFPRDSFQHGETHIIAASRRSNIWWYYALLLVVLVLLFVAMAPRLSSLTNQFNSDVPQAWFRLSLQLVQDTPGYTPPVASRSFGYLGVTLYETVQPGMWRYQSLVGQLNGLDKLPQEKIFVRYHWPAAANAALASMTRRLFPTAPAKHQAAIDELERTFAEQFRAQVDAAVYEQSAAWGRQIADAIYVWSTTDGGHEGYARNFSDSYLPPAGDYAWVSTAPAYARSLQPSWGNNRPFVLSDGEACPAPAYPEYSEQPGEVFYEEAWEVYSIDRNRSPEERAVALFWADEAGQTATPPGHWISILTQVLAAEESSLAVAAEAYARLGMAVSDSFISCWYTKYQYNLLRPITYIQRVIDPTWYPDGVIANAITTPPFPEYTSGHSVQSAAAALVLSSIFGEERAFVDATHAAIGLPARSFASFHEAATEASLSRLYGGIHFRSAVEIGMEQGYCVGEAVNAVQFRR